MMAKMELKRFNEADELRELPKTRIEVLNFGETTIMRMTLQPGWKWSESVKPTVGTHSCEAPHFNYVISGRLMVAMDDGTKIEIGPGEVAAIPPGHDAWVVGNEPFVGLDFTAGKMYGVAKS